MERQYRLMYRLGLTPWNSSQMTPAVRDLVEGPSALAAGIALDLGCGTGENAAALAARGWDVTGIDVAAAAIRRARRRSALVSWHVADLTGDTMSEIGDRLAGRVSLILDVGCLHGLGPRGRCAWSETVHKVAAADARLLLWAAPHRGGRTILPRGMDPDEIARTLGSRWARVSHPSDPGWSLHRRVR